MKHSVNITPAFVTNREKSALFKTAHQVHPFIAQIFTALHYRFEIGEIKRPPNLALHQQVFVGIVFKWDIFLYQVYQCKAISGGERNANRTSARKGELDKILTVGFNYAAFFWYRVIIAVPVPLKSISLYNLLVGCTQAHGYGKEIGFAKKPFFHTARCCPSQIKAAQVYIIIAAKPKCTPSGIFHGSKIIGW